MWLRCSLGQRLWPTTHQMSLAAAQEEPVIESEYSWGERGLFQMLYVGPNKAHRLWQQTSQRQKCVTQHIWPFNWEIRATECPRLKRSFFCLLVSSYGNRALLLKRFSLLFIIIRFYYKKCKFKGFQPQWHTSLASFPGMSRVSGICEDQRASADTAGRLLPQANIRHTALVICKRAHLNYK